MRSCVCLACVCVCVCVCVCLCVFSHCLRARVCVCVVGVCVFVCVCGLVAQDRSAWRQDCLICHQSFRQPGDKQGTNVAQSKVSLSRISVVLCSVVHAEGGFTLVVACVCIIVCPVESVRAGIIYSAQRPSCSLVFDMQSAIQVSAWFQTSHVRTWPSGNQV